MKYEENKERADNHCRTTCMVTRFKSIFPSLMIPGKVDLNVRFFIDSEGIFAYNAKCKCTTESGLGGKASTSNLID